MVMEPRNVTTFRHFLVLPIATVFLSTVTFGISYGVGLKLARINSSTIAFISDTGDLRPHSSIFSLGISLSCIMTLVIIIVRYYQVKIFYIDNPLYQKINLFSLISGLILVLGSLIVAAFQLSSEKHIHYLGASMYFGGATFFCVTQSYFTYKKEKLRTHFIVIVRITCTAVMLTSLLVFGIFMTPSLTKYNRNGKNVAQFFEWLLVCCQLVFMLTFLFDFWKVEIELNFILRKINDDKNSFEVTDLVT